MRTILSLGPAARMAVYVYALLVAATAAVALVKHLRPRLNAAELEARTRSWWVMATLLFLAIYVDARLSLVFFAFLSFWALKEYVTLLETRPADHGALVLAFLAVPVQYYWIARNDYGFFVIFVPVYIFLLLPVRLVLAKETRGFVSAASKIQWGLMAFVFGLSHLAYVAVFPRAGAGGADGRTLLLFLVFVAEMSDVLQYVWGKTTGRHKVIPSVSPNKTWEGLLGGVASACALSLLIRFLTPFSVGETLLVALLVCLAGFLGGAVMSAVKRDFGVKDFGTLIPGHGGMLDRLDSLCYAAPVFFHYVRYFHYRGFGA
jgi:phosphatidate cytidylyltransferase